jgi:hypothetical protein
MQVAPGLALDLDSDSTDGITPIGVAQGLAKQCRYVGHTLGPLTWYSVAEHAVRGAMWFEAQGQLDLAVGFLHHDDAEFVAPDVPRPVKDRLIAIAGFDAYGQLSDDLHKRIALALGYDFELCKRREVKMIDTLILHDEQRAFMAPPPRTWGLPGDALGIQIECWPPGRAMAEWAAMHLRLMGDQLPPDKLRDALAAVEYTVVAALGEAGQCRGIWSCINPARVSEIREMSAAHNARSAA